MLVLPLTRLVGRLRSPFPGSLPELLISSLPALVSNDPCEQVQSLSVELSSSIEKSISSTGRPSPEAIEKVPLVRSIIVR